MRKYILFICSLAFVVSCSNQNQNKPSQAQLNNEKPPQAQSCKDYCKEQCQGLQATCETNCLNACYPQGK